VLLLLLLLLLVLVFMSPTTSPTAAENRRPVLDLAISATMRLETTSATLSNLVRSIPYQCYCRLLLHTIGPDKDVCNACIVWFLYAFKLFISSGERMTCKMHDIGSVQSSPAVLMVVYNVVSLRFRSVVVVGTRFHESNDFSHGCRKQATSIRLGHFGHDASRNDFGHLVQGLIDSRQSILIF
jgi:hypothetical protein